MATNRADQPVDQAMVTAESGAGLTQALSMVPQSQSITVNHENVLKAAKIIQDVLDNEGQQITSTFGQLQVIPPGRDPVSVQAAKAWNAKLLTDPDSYQNRVMQYLDSLQTLVTNLKVSALQYGYSEQQIADTFGQTGSAGA